MKTAFRKSFTRDLKKIKDKGILTGIQEAIERVEDAAKLEQIADLKKMGGTSGFYRIRIGDLRIGIARWR